MANTQYNASLTKKSAQLENFMDSNIFNFLNICFITQINSNCYISDQVSDDKIKIFYNFTKTIDYRFELRRVKQAFNSFAKEYLNEQNGKLKVNI